MARDKSWNPDLRMADYRPAITVQGFASRGKSTRIAGYTTGRVHHLFSQTEYHAFLLYDWLPEIVDIREQYALPVEETMVIARELGIDHISDKKTGRPHPVTSDFVLTRDRDECEIVRSCKRSSELGSIRTLAKLEVERQYWLRRGVEWKLVTERDLPGTLIENLKFLHPFHDPESTDVPPEHRQSLIQNLWSVLVDNSTRKFGQICTDLDLKIGLNPGCHLALAKYAIANRRWPVDMHARISGTDRLPMRTAAEHVSPA